jgi:hypothetical protein
MSEEDESHQRQVGESPLNWRQIATGLFMTVIVSFASFVWSMSNQIQDLRETDIRLQNDINIKCPKLPEKNAKIFNDIAPALPGN